MADETKDLKYGREYIYNPDTKMDRRLQEDRLGEDIIDECRTQLMLKFRFLDLALWRMDLLPARVGSMFPLATDGDVVMYDPPRVIGRFQESFDESVRDYLHMIMHCVFRHPYEKNKKLKEAWNLTCDIIAESTAMDLCGERFKSDKDLERRMAVSKIKLAAGGFSPSKIYRLVEGLERTGEGQHFHGIGTSALAEWRALFERDDHGAWPIHAKPDESEETSDRSPEEEFSENDENPDMQSDGLRSDSPEGQSPETDQGQRNQTPNNSESDDASKQGSQGGGNEDQEDESEQTDAQQDPQDSQSDDDDEQDNQESNADGGGSFTPQDERTNDRDEEERQRSDEQDDKSEKDWEEIAKQIEMNLSTFSKEWGDEAATLMANLQMSNRKRYDYTDFLRKFMVVNEEMQLNMDEFDTIFYTFGMDMYGNMPFIEPLEYKETQRIHDFAIIIDTSESVRGDLVRKFIEHTFDILKSSEDYSSTVNVHLIQADAKVQQDTKISNLRDVDKVMQNFVIRGMGGTDFRPAIDYVEMLRYRGEFDDLRGVLYFTDGFGQFPEKAPDYDVAFVFIDDEEKEIPPVPPWAIKVTIDENLLDE